MYFDKDLFYGATGINLNEYNLVTKVEVEYYPNSSRARSISICPSPIIQNSLDEIYEELERIGRGLLISDEEIKCSIYAETENFIILNVKSISNEGTIQSLYEFVKKG